MGFLGVMAHGGREGENREEQNPKVVARDHTPEGQGLGFVTMLCIAYTTNKNDEDVRTSFQVSIFIQSTLLICCVLNTLPNRSCPRDNNIRVLNYECMNIELFVVQYKEMIPWAFITFIYIFLEEQKLFRFHLWLNSKIYYCSSQRKFHSRFIYQNN